MRDRFLNAWEILRGSLLFIPALLTVVSIAIAVALLELDRHLTSGTMSAWIFPGGPEGAREILSTIASSTITVAGVAFSITIVALSLAASQYGSLLLTSYLRDPVSQTALGTFIGTFVYCLVVLSTVSEADGARFTPPLAVSFSLVLALGSLVAFVIFINHLAQSMQSERLVSRIGEALIRAVAEMFPEELQNGSDGARPKTRLPANFESAWEVAAPTTGFLQAIEGDRLLNLATERGLLVRLAVRPGDFVSAGSAVASVLGRAGVERTETAKAIQGRMLIGRQRTPTQDPEYAVHQLSQTAVRALSSGINDPYTALTCIDWLEAALRLLTKRWLPAETRFDTHGELRVITRDLGFEPMANAALNKIRHAGRNQASIILRLINLVGNVASEAIRASDREVLLRHLDALREEASTGLETEGERKEAEALCQEVRSRIKRLDA